MSQRIVARAPHTQALKAVLATTGHPVGLGAIPEPGAGWQDAPGVSDFVAYYVIHPILGGWVDGPIDTPDEDAELVFQVTTVAATFTTCEAVNDAARRALLTVPLVVVGRSICRVQLSDLDGPHRDETVQPHVWFTHETHRLITTPS